MEILGYGLDGKWTGNSWGYTVGRRGLGLLGIGIEDRQERVEYVQDVVELVDDSQIPALSKRTIKSGATIALESSLLWNIE